MTQQFPLIIIAIATVLISTILLTAIIMTILTASGQEDNWFNKQFNQVLYCTFFISGIICVMVARSNFYTSAPQTIKESIVYTNHLNADIIIDAPDLKINTHDATIVPDIRKAYTNGAYDKQGNITIKKNNITLTRQFKDIVVSGPEKAIAIKQIKLVDTKTVTHFFGLTETYKSTTLNITFADYPKLKDSETQKLLDKLIGNK